MVKKQEYRMLMVRDKIIRKMLTLYPGFSSAGIGVSVRFGTSL